MVQLNYDLLRYLGDCIVAANNNDKNLAELDVRRQIDTWIVESNEYKVLKQIALYIQRTTH